MSTKKLIFDTSAIINFLGNEPDVSDLDSLMLEFDCFVSVITRMELLKEMRPIIWCYIHIVSFDLIVLALPCSGPSASILTNHPVEICSKYYFVIWIIADWILVDYGQFP
ncbi:hypothetical protein FACS189491_03320 [Spirochaetia bacterium]|nr:hypothetical protein FACS189491_03320 [Spirochaetia bacterium]